MYTHPMTRAIELRCTSCGEVTRFRTPDHTHVQAKAVLGMFVGYREPHSMAVYGPQLLSDCHQAPLEGRLLGYDLTPRTISKKLDLSDVVEVGPSKAQRLVDARTDEWSDSDPTPVETVANRNVIRKRGEKGQV